MQNHTRILTLAALATIFCGLTYVSVQQDLRQSANDPQIQIAEDLAAELGTGQSAGAVIPKNKVDIRASLAPFVIVYDETGKAIASSGFLAGNMPTIPMGVLDAARTTSENRVTWQPEADVRDAIVVIHFGGPHSGFVVAGRSLREIEIREDQLTKEVGAAWIVALIVIAVSAMV